MRGCNLQGNSDVGVRKKCGQYGQQILRRNPSKKIMSVSGAEIGRYSGKKVAHYGITFFSELSLLFSPPIILFNPPSFEWARSKPSDI